jgi:hypothetical protein
VVGGGGGGRGVRRTGPRVLHAIMNPFTLDGCHFFSKVGDLEKSDWRRFMEGEKFWRTNGQDKGDQGPQLDRYPH